MDYSIPNSIKYRTPTYIHSHPTELPIENFFTQTMESRIQMLEQDIIQTITSIYNYLKNISTSSEVLDFYMSTHNGQRRNLNASGKVKMILDSFKNAKSKLQSLQDIQTKNNTIKDINNTVNDF
jgi:hypothetical protein